MGAEQDEMFSRKRNRSFRVLIEKLFGLVSIYLVYFQKLQNQQIWQI